MKVFLPLLLGAAALGTPGFAATLTNDNSEPARREGLPATLTARNAALVLSLNTQNGALSVTDQRTGRRAGAVAGRREGERGAARGPAA